MIKCLQFFCEKYKGCLCVDFQLFILFIDSLRKLNNCSDLTGIPICRNKMNFIIKFGKP